MDLLDLPPGVLLTVLQHLYAQGSFKDTAAFTLASTDCDKLMRAVLQLRTTHRSNDHRELSHLQATRLFRFLGRHCPNLDTISVCYAADRLYGGSLLDASLTSLFAAVPRLRHLTMLNVDVTDTVLLQLAARCPRLCHLAFGRTENNAFGNFVSDLSLAALASSCQHLDSLVLFRCYSVSDASLAELVRQGRQLRSLTLHSCPQVTALGLVKFLEATPTLQQLDVLMPETGPGGAAVTFSTCFALAAHCPMLKVLRLSEELLSGTVLDDSCLTVIARGCTQLQELELVQVEVSDASMAALASHCTQLTSLRLEQTYVGDEGMHKVLKACPLLQELRVAGCSTHSWMLPAEYMYAGLSVAGLQSMAAAEGAGLHLKSLDLSCLSYEPPAGQDLLGPTAAAAVAAAAAAAGAVTAAEAADIPGSSSSSFNSVASVIARLSLDSNTSNRSSHLGSSRTSRSSSAASSPSSSGGCSIRHCRHSPQDLDSAQSAAPAGCSDLLGPFENCAPLIPVDWCGRLQGLCLDWLKVQGQALQGPLLSTLRCCSSLRRLSLVGYPGSVDELLSCVADAGSAVTHLNLQHSQVSDMGLAVAAMRLPKLQSLYLSYCRNISDAGLDSVGSMQQLQDLDLYNTPCVSAAAVARVARYCLKLRRLYIGHNTSALNRTPAQAKAIGYISSSDNSKYANCTSSVWALVSEAAASRIGGQQLAVLCRNPTSSSEFEQRSLRQLLSVSGEELCEV